jgi:putative heme iron utilization protein
MLDDNARRLDFPARVTTPDDLRKTLVKLTQQARGR